jgi:hypothetical protein
MTPRSKIIEKSLSCLDCGMAAMIPVGGLLFAALGLDRFRFVVTETDDRWNPARPHLFVGAGLAVLSLLAHAIAAVLVGLYMLRAAADG